MMQEMQQKLEKSYFYVKKNTQYTEFNQILLPLKFLNIIVNKFSYINSNATNHWCTIPMDINIMLGPHKENFEYEKIGTKLHNGIYNLEIEYIMSFQVEYDRWMFSHCHGDGAPCASYSAGGWMGAQSCGLQNVLPTGDLRSCLETQFTLNSF